MRLLFLTTLLCLSQVAYSKQLSVNVSAKNAILINAETGAVLYDKEAHQLTFPASITKIATALYVLEKKGSSLEEIATATEDDLLKATPQNKLEGKEPSYRLEPTGSHMSIKTGESLSLRVLLYGLLLSSANDAANVLARSVSGNIPAFVAELNAFLQKQGLKETLFQNPNGFYHPQHRTSAYDLAKMTQIGLRDPTFREIVKTLRYPRPQTNKNPEMILQQTNRLLKAGQFFYPKAIGVKTGYVAKAGPTLVAAAQQGDRTLIAVLLNSQDIYQRFRDAITLFDTAFAEKKVSRTLFSKEYDRFTLPIKGGKWPLEGRLGEDCKLEYYPAEEPECKALLHWKEITLPVKQDQLVGEIHIVNQEGQILRQLPLYALKAVPETFWYKVNERATAIKIYLFRKEALIIALMAITTLIAYFSCQRKKLKDSL